MRKAYAEPLDVTCNTPKCTRRATMKVFTGMGHVVGVYCRTHAGAAVIHLNKRES